MVYCPVSYKYDLSPKQPFMVPQKLTYWHKSNISVWAFGFQLLVAMGSTESREYEYWERPQSTSF